MPMMLDNSIDLEQFGVFVPGGRTPGGVPLANLLVCPANRLDSLTLALEREAVLGVKEIHEQFAIAGLVIATSRVYIERVPLIVLEVHTYQAQAMVALAQAFAGAVHMGPPDPPEGGARRVIIPGGP